MNTAPGTDTDVLVDALLEADSQPRVVLDDAGRVRRASPTARSLFNETAWEWQDALLEDWLSEAERERWREVLAQAIRHGDASRTVWHPAAGSGTSAEIGLSLIPVSTDRGTTVIIGGIETGAHRSGDGRERGLLATLLELVTRQADLSTVYERALDLVTERFPGARAVITRRQGEALVVIHTRNVPPEVRPLIARQPLDAQYSPCGAAAVNNRPAACRDLQRDPTWPALSAIARTYDLRADWSYPIPSEDGHHAIGTLAVLQTHEALPDEAGGTLLREIAQLVGLAIHRHERLSDLQRRAFHDPLTGLANRQLLEDRLEQTLAVGRRNGRPLAVLMLDLDNFKQVNDSLGHAAGDDLLIEVAGRLRERLRPSDTVARLGGDEFVILLPETDRSGAEAVAQSVLDSLQRPIELEGTTRSITPSIGVTVSGARVVSAGELLRAADRAMYRVKVNGKDGIAFLAHGEQGASGGRTPLLAVDLSSEEISRGVTMVATARCDADDGVVAIRAAIRWTHPRFGRMSFARLLRLLEARGRRAVAESAGAAALARVGIGEALDRLDARLVYAPGTTSLSDPEFGARMDEYIRSNRMAPRGFQLDLAAALEDQGSVARLTELCTDMRGTIDGVRLSMSGFGGADAPLNAVSAMAVDTLILTPDSLALPDDALCATIALARQLAREVVVGGLTETAQVRRAREAGIALTEGPVHAERLPAGLPRDDGTVRAPG